jgi:hypothetical protein
MEYCKQWGLHVSCFRFLGAFDELRKETISCIMSVSSQFRPLAWDGFSWNWIFEYFSKIFREDSSLIKIWQEWQALYIKTIYFFIVTRSFLVIIRNIFKTNLIDKIQTHISYSKRFCFKSWSSVEKYGRTGQTTVDNMAHTYCVMDT